MAGKWQETTLGEVIELKRGYDLPKRERFPGPVPLVSSSGVTDYHTASKVAGPGVVTGRYGTLGEVFFVREDFWPLNTTLYVRDFKSNNPQFISYFLKGIDFLPFSDKAAVPGLNRNHLHQAPVWFPDDVNEQRAIAHILGTLDDKIELNRRMNETLEAMARALFKDWFVDFGPTRAQIEGRDPYLAPELWDLFPDALDDEDKPAGWAEIPLKKLGTVITGKTPSTKKPEFFGDDMPFLKIPDMRGKIYVLRTSTELSEDGVSSQKKKTLPPGSVSVSCIATPGLVIFNHQDTQTNQQINSLIPSDLRQSHFVFWSCRQLASAVMLGGSGGSVFHNMNKTSFENLRLVYPGEEIARMYSKTVSPMHNRMLSSEYQSDSLAQTRDLLLPKLMSGEIRVSDADKIVQEFT